MRYGQPLVLILSIGIRVLGKDPSKFNAPFVAIRYHLELGNVSESFSLSKDYEGIELPPPRFQSHRASDSFRLSCAEGGIQLRKSIVDTSAATANSGADACSNRDAGSGADTAAGPNANTWTNVRQWQCTGVG